MAYFIFNSDNNLVKIAANDSDRDSQNLILSNHSVVTVSNDDFLKAKTGSFVIYDGTNVTFRDQDSLFSNDSHLQSYFNNVTEAIEEFSKENSDNSLYTDLNNYKEYLENFDVSSVSFPLNKSWEQYCNENSITFYHPLQIP